MCTDNLSFKIKLDLIKSFQRQYNANTGPGKKLVNGAGYCGGKTPDKLLQQNQTKSNKKQALTLPVINLENDESHFPSESGRSSSCSEQESNNSNITVTQQLPHYQQQQQQTETQDMQISKSSEPQNSIKGHKSAQNFRKTTTFISSINREMQIQTFEL